MQRRIAHFFVLLLRGLMTDPGGPLSLSHAEEVAFDWDGGILLTCLSRLRFRLKAAARHRLAIDIAALCTGLRVAVMVDYAQGVSQLQTQLCRLLDLLAQEANLISLLKVMCLDDVVYLIHLENLTLSLGQTLDGSVKLEFIVLDDSTIRFALPSEKDEALKEFASFAFCFLSQTSKVSESTCGSPSSSNSHLIDLGNSELCCEAALPTLNGWLLGYPAVYYFKKENVSKAVRTLSLCTIHQFTIIIQSFVGFQTFEVQGQKGSSESQILTSFTIPNELNGEQVAEDWASKLESKVKKSQFWRSSELQIMLQVCPSVVL